MATNNTTNIGYTPANKAGDTFTGAVTVNGTGVVATIGNGGFSADAYVNLNSRFQFGYDGTYHAAKIYDGGNNKPLYVTLNSHDRYLFENSSTAFHLMMQQPTGQSATATTGGSLAAATYYFKVVALDIANNETGQYTEVSAVIDGVTNTKVNLSWTAPPKGVNGYRIYYGTTPGGEANYFSVGSGVTSYAFTTTTGSTSNTFSTFPTASTILLSGNGNSWFNGGNIGINTATPNSLFHVFGNLTTEWLTIGYGTNPTYITTDALKTLAVQQNGTQVAAFDSSYNFALGYKSFTPTYGLHVMGGRARLQGLGTATAPTITNVGTTGSTTYTYYIVARDQNGNRSFVSPSGVTTTGNATLNGTNYNTITWSAVSNAYSYDILKTDSAHSLATNITALTYNDQGGSTSAYTASTHNETADMYVDGFFGVGITAPTAKVHLGAGTSSAGTAPLKLTAGTNLTTAEDGAIEYDGNQLFYDIGTNRYQISMQTSMRTFDPAVMRQTANFAQTLCGTAVFPQAAVRARVLSVWIFTLNASHPTIELGIYSAAGAKLGSATGVPTAIGIFTVTLGTPIILSAGTLYYFCYLNQTNETTTAVGTAYGFSTDTTLSFTQGSLTSMPSNWGALVNSSNNNWWIAAGT